MSYLSYLEVQWWCCAFWCLCYYYFLRICLLPTFVAKIWRLQFLCFNHDPFNILGNL
uniref:Uncharacterized protein n=1 Tax=Rhizophora mucronata TaxID=61149 RepID=A0A2P2NSR2_RHIMU